MKNRIRTGVCFWMLLCLVIVSGCSKKEPVDSEYKLYLINQEGTGLVETVYEGEIENPKAAVEEMIEKLGTMDDELGVQPAIPKEVKLKQYTLEEEKLSLYFNSEYTKMDTVQEVLCRAALVRSLTQIDEVDQVAFYVDEKPLTNKEGEEYGFLQAEDFSPDRPGEQHQSRHRRKGELKAD